MKSSRAVGPCPTAIHEENTQHPYEEETNNNNDNEWSASAAEDGLDRQRMEEENQQRGGEEGERSDRYLYKNAGGEDFRHLQYTGQVDGGLREDIEEDTGSQTTEDNAKSSAHEELTFRSLSQLYRHQVTEDITSCSSVPSLLVEILGSIFAIANIAVAFIAYQEVSYMTTGMYYHEYASDVNVKHHDQPPAEGNPETIHIYAGSVFKNWRNFAHLSIALTIFELAGPALRLLILTNNTIKKINTIHSLVQISQLTCLVLEDGATALCKCLLFIAECGIRTPLMSQINKISASMSLVNSIFKTVLFIWRSSFRNQRIERDEMEQYTEILILEEYQWYHCIIPILCHISVIGLSIWALAHATNHRLLCNNLNY